MNVIAADMCTNARRVRKRWLPKIKSMLPDGMEVYQGSSTAISAGLSIGGLPLAVQMPFESDFKNLLPLGLEQRIYAERKDPMRTHSLLVADASDLPAEGAEGTQTRPRLEEEDEEEEPQTDGAEGMLGTAPVLPGAEGGVGVATPPTGQQEEVFVEGLRINGQ